MPDSDVHEAIQLDADISALVSPSVSELWRAMHGYPAEATGAVAAHRALAAGLPAQWSVDANGNLTINSDTQYDDNETLLTLHATGSPGDRNTVEINSDGNGDWTFLSIGGGGALDFWRLIDANNRVAVCRIRESGVVIVDSTGAESLLEADHEVNGLGLAQATGCKLGFFTFAGGGAVKQTGVPVTAEGIHAALVAYGLIAA